MFLLVQILVVILCLSRPLWADKNYVALSTTQATFNMQNTDIAIPELIIANVVTTSFELVHLSVDLHVYAESVDDELIITIYNQEMMAIASTSAKATYDGQAQSVEMTFIDNPSPGNHTYGIKCSGTGIVSYNSSTSRFEAHVVPNSNKLLSAVPSPFPLQMPPKASVAADSSRMPTELPCK